MSNTPWKRDEIDSPCTKICSIHPETRLCIGCFRSIDEIGKWSSISAEKRSSIMAELPARSALFKKRRGGRNRHKLNPI